jgi:hypothetical protein
VRGRTADLQRSCKVRGPRRRGNEDATADPRSAWRTGGQEGGAAPTRSRSTQSAWVSTFFDGLLDPSTYADDEPVRVAVDRAELWVSERVWSRLWHIGCAYDLHLLKLLEGGTDRVTLNANRAAALGDELAFVRTVTTDRVLMATIDDMSDLAVRAAQSGRDGAFSVEGPEPSSADLAPRRSVVTIGWARDARSRQSVRVAMPSDAVWPCFLGGSLRPIGCALSFLDASRAEVLEAVLDVRGERCEVSIPMPLPACAWSLDPTEVPWTKELLIECDGWTAYLNNGIYGGDLSAIAPAIARWRGWRCVGAEHMPKYGPGHAATQLWMQGPRGEPPLDHVRTLGAYAEDGRWSWHESGEPQSFEVTDRYLARRKRDRLDRALLVDYLGSLGIRVDDRSSSMRGSSSRRTSIGPSDASPLNTFGATTTGRRSDLPDLRPPSVLDAEVAGSNPAHPTRSADIPEWASEVLPPWCTPGPAWGGSRSCSGTLTERHVEC